MKTAGKYPAHNPDVQSLGRTLIDHAPCLVLTGAGVSVDSGLGTYRDDSGDWKRKQPITIQAFLAGLPARQRYWARSYVGWKQFSRAQPNSNHHALLELHKVGVLSGLVTQNVDSLHTAAGHPDVVDLHGTINNVKCIQCQAELARDVYQQAMLNTNPDLESLAGSIAPDGDSDLDDSSFDGFDWLQPPACQECSGIMKPDVVFFGENVQREKVEHVYKLLEQSKSLLVVGSSLMVFSGYRFARRAAESGKQVAILNRGTTRADELATLKVSSDSSTVLQQTVELLRSSA